MTDYSWGQLWGLWDGAGGRHDKGAMMASIAEAESSGDSIAVSPAGAIGCWQVMPFWASDFGWPVSLLYSGHYSAVAAVRISGNGANVGAWDTCYNPPSSAAYRKNLSEPEQGSPAWNIWHGSSGGPQGGGGGVQTVSHSGPDAYESQIARQTIWANHLQEHAIPDNTRWVSFNRKLHYHGPTIV